MSSPRNTVMHSRPGRTCPTCSAVLPGEAQFCGSCGHRFADLKATLVRQRAETSQPQSAGPGPLGQLPVTLGAYRVESIIGAGGMGTVYKAVDIGLERLVALKTLSPELSGTSEARQRFEREARTVAALNHPNITGIYFLDARSQVPYYAMEYVEGESLDDRLGRQGKLSPIEACRVIAQAASALSAAAAAGVVHRDIKPSNILLRASDNTVKLTDFGLAKPQAAKGLTGDQIIVGTPLYMSPEQAMGKPLDFRSDLYSLGVTFYHSLAGHPPFDDDSALGVLVKHLNAPLPPLAPLVPDAPEELVLLIEKMLAKEPAGRHASYEEFLRELNAVGGAFRRSRPVSTSSVRKAVAAAPRPSSSATQPSALAPQPEAPPAVVDKPRPSGFWSRCWAILSKPGDFVQTIPLGGPVSEAIGHFLTVAAIGALCSVGLKRLPQSFVAFSLITAIQGAIVLAVLKVRRAGSARDALVIACYASTPLLIGGLRLAPLNIFYMGLLMLSGAFRLGRK